MPTAPKPNSDVRRFPCEGCGSALEFRIGALSVVCPHCSFVKDLQVIEAVEVSEHGLEEALAKMVARRSAAPLLPGRRELTCRTCAATLVIDGALTPSECAHCGNTVVDADVHAAIDRLPADGVVPFQVDRERAQQAFHAWVESLWFAPTEFKRRGVQGKFNGLYLPYWIFDAMTVSRYAGERGEHYWETDGHGKRVGERRTRWHSVSGSFQRFFDDVRVSAKSELPHRLTHGLEPWPLDKCIPFDVEVLTGYTVMTYDQELRAGFTQAKDQIREALEEDVRRRIGGDEQRIQDIDTRYGAFTYKHLLLPVWMLAYAWNEKTYQIIVNAINGEVDGERPYSWVKIALALAVAMTLLIVAVSLSG